MTEYMKEVLDWMCGEKRRYFSRDDLGEEVMEYYRQKKEVYDRCAPHITDEDLGEAYDYAREHYGGGVIYALQGFEEYDVIPARKRLKKQKEKKRCQG